MYATADEFRAQFRALTPEEDTRLVRLLRRASRLIDRHVYIDPTNLEQVADARDVVLDMVSRAFPVVPGTDGLRSWTQSAGAVTESATFAGDGGAGELALLPWHLELLGAAAGAVPRFRFPASRIPSWL